MSQNYHFEIHLIPIHAITLGMLSSVEITLKSLAFTAGLHNRCHSPSIVSIVKLRNEILSLEVSRAEGADLK